MRPFIVALTALVAVALLLIISIGATAIEIRFDDTMADAVTAPGAPEVAPMLLCSAAVQSPAQKVKPIQKSIQKPTQRAVQKTVVQKPTQKPTQEGKSVRQRSQGRRRIALRIVGRAGRVVIRPLRRHRE